MNEEEVIEITAPIFFTPTTSNRVEMSLANDEEDHNSGGGRLVRGRQRPLLVRSLSVAASETAKQRSLELKSLSETCLSSSCDSAVYYQQTHNGNAVLPPELIATNVDDDDDDDEEEDEVTICTCGCGVALTASAIAGSRDNEEFESEDEGCYFVTTTKQTDSPPITRGEEEEGSREHEGKAGAIVVDSVQVKSSPLQKANLAQSRSSAVETADNSKTAANSGERRSFSLSVDSGRSSNTGTLGHASTASKFSSSASASSSGEEDNNSSTHHQHHHSVEIVSHTFCDFLDNRSKREDLPEEEVDEQVEANQQQHQQGANKVSVFVPYSAITDLRRRESIALVNNPRRKAGSAADVFGSADNVVICDTQVILRINSQPQKQEEEKVELEKEENKTSSSTSKYSRRMARRMTTTVAVYEMVKAKSEVSKAEIEEEEEDQVSGSSHHHHRAPQTAAMNKSPPAQFTATHHRRRRKDLCKLLGLIECDVTTDATNPDDIQMARKVALENLISAIEAKHEGKVKVVAEEEQVEAALPQETPLTPRKKDLAKFLGIDDSHTNNTNTNNNNSNPSHSVQSVQEEVVVNKKPSSNNNRPFLQMMKNTIKWNHSKSAAITSISSDKSAEKNNNGDLEELLDVYQLKKANEVIFGSLNKNNPANQDGNRTNRKNLNKYLGLDDSDSDEMVFIQNRKNKPSMADNDSSLNRSEQGSSSGVVSVIGIKIDPVDEDGICDDIIASNSSTYSSSPTSSTLDLRPRTRRKASLNNFLRHSSSRLKSNQVFDKKNTNAKEEEEQVEMEDEEEEEEEEFSPPPRKSVLFKEYDFSVEESIATGFPVIPNINGTANSSSMHSSTSSSSRKIERKKKKDAAKRSAEILSSSHRRQRGEHHLNCSPPPPPPPPPPPAPVQQISECCDECRDKNMLHVEEDSFSSSSERQRRGKSSPNKQKRVKVQRGAMVRRHKLLIPENGGDPIFLGAAAQAQAGAASAPPSAAHVPLMAVPPPPPPPHAHAHAHYFPQMIPATHVVSYPNGRVRVVPWHHYQHIQQHQPMSRQQRRDLMDLQELKKVFQP